MSVIIGGPYNSGILATGATEGAYYNYAPADAEMLLHVRRIESVCARHGISLRAAALQFPLGRAAVASVIPGSRSAAELAQNLAALSEEIDDAFWAELKHEGLVPEDAATPPQTTC